MRAPPSCSIRGALLIVMGCALIVGLSRDVPTEARDAGQLGVLAAFGAMVALQLGARVAGRPVA